MILNKFENYDGDRQEMSKLWESLVNILNGLGYGQKTVNKWQLVGFFLGRTQFCSLCFILHNIGNKSLEEQS